MDEQSKRKSYQTDLSDEEWNKIEPHVPKRKMKVGRKRKSVPGDTECHILYCTLRLCMAVVASRFSAMANSILLRPYLEAK